MNGQTTQTKDDLSDMKSNNPALDFRKVDLRDFPPLHTYPRQYWFIPTPAKQVQWLLDQKRIDDAVVYFLFGVGTSFRREIPFLDSHPDCDEIVARLRREGRIKRYGDGLPRSFRTNELVLGPKSGIELIVRDVEFLDEKRHPWYTGPEGILRS